MAIERVFIGEGVKEAEVKNFLISELKRAGVAGITIQRTPLVTRIILYCDRPALVIGRKGRNVKALTKTIEEDFRIEKPEIEVKKVDKPNLEPAIVAYRISSALERGMNSRRVGYRALQAIMRDGAKGAEIVLSGKLVGKGGRARVLKMKAGYLKKCGQPSLEQVRHGETIATCKAGTIGIEVSVVPQNVHFPDEINIIRPEDFEIEEAVEEPKEEKKSPKTEEKPSAKDKKEDKSKDKSKADKSPKKKEDKELKGDKTEKEEKKPPKKKEDKEPAKTEKEEKKPEEKPKAEKKEAPKEGEATKKSSKKGLEFKEKSAETEKEEEKTPAKEEKK